LLACKIDQCWRIIETPKAERRTSHHQYFGDGGVSAIASCGASRNFVKTRTLMESYVAVSFALSNTNRASIYFAIEWGLVDWFLLSLFLVAAVILSLMLHLPSQ
jgi:hypothetical protein